MDALKDYLAAVPPAQYCQLFFILSTSLVLLLCVLPDAARRTLLDYGARSPKTATKDVKADVKPAPATGLEGFVVGLTSYGQVPHSWFLHFYVLSVAWSAFWAWQFLSKGSAMGALARWQTTSADGSVDPGRVFVSWCLMALQGSRRLYESLYVSKPGSSPMWFVHWALGLVYYTAMGMSIWIEGSGSILEYWESPKPVTLVSTKVPTALAVYCIAMAKQNECHKYLASLKKYTLPTEGWFRYLICPHYTCECLIYLAIAFIAAPDGSLFNVSVLCGLLFVVVNLGATANGTKQWYAGKFGADKVAGRWSMIPFLF